MNLDLHGSETGDQLISLAAAIGVVLAVGVAVWWGSNQQTIKAKRGYAVSQLRDPDSVQFRAERLTGEGWLCGELNGKNAYGAYAGFNRFLSRAPDDVHIEGIGYAGEKGGQSTRQIIDDLDVSIEVSQGLLAVAKASPGLPAPTPEEVEAMRARAIFKKRWASHCI